jgi:predicted transcriptional regulator
MQITLPDDPLLSDQAHAAGFVSLDQYVMDLLTRDADRIAILQGLADFKAGRFRDAEAVEADLRRELDVSRVCNRHASL